MLSNIFNPMTGKWANCSNSLYNMCMTQSTYRDDYPKRKIGKGNPYYCCAQCGISDPQINGELKNHQPYCEWRIAEELKEQLK